MVRNVVLLLGVAGVFLGSNIHERVSYSDESKSAMHVFLPGYIEAVSPEHVIRLENWVGTRRAGFTMVNAEGTEIPEVSAAEVLREIGIASPEYILEQEPSGHYVLRKPAHYERVFSWRTPYRVGPWHPINK